MKGRFFSVLLILFFVGKISCSAIPIWEMLTYQEKMGRLMYTYVYLVERYCKTSSAPDCRKIMTLHGVSNLLNYDEHTLDLLDPDQRNASALIWQAATKSQYKFPIEKNQDHDIYKSSLNDDFEAASSRDEPQMIRVPAPKFFLRQRSIRQKYWNH